MICPIIGMRKVGERIINKIEKIRVDFNVALIEPVILGDAMASFWG